MSRLCVAGILTVALVLVAGTILTAAEEGQKGDGAPRQQRAAGRRAGAEAGRTPRPQVEVSKEDLAKMEPEIKLVQDAIAELQAKALKILGDERAARTFVTQTVLRNMRQRRAGEAAGPQGVERAQRRRGEGRERNREGGDEK